MRYIRQTLATVPTARWVYRQCMKLIWVFRHAWRRRSLRRRTESRQTRLERLGTQLRNEKRLESLVQRLVLPEFVWHEYGLALAPTGPADSNSLVLKNFLQTKDPNPYFDTDFYLANYGVEVETSGLTPFEHYLRFGAVRGHRPSPMFASPWLDTTAFEAFLNMWPDLEQTFSDLFIGNAPEIPSEMLRPSRDLRRGLGTFDMSRVAILIPVFNNWVWTERCLRAIRRCSDARDAQVFVVDDGSTDGTAQFIQTLFPAVQLLSNEENVGFLESCNRAYELLKSRFDFVLLLNNDTEPLPGFLSELLATMIADPEVGLVGSRLVYPDGRIQEAGGLVWQDGNAWNFGRNEFDGLGYLVERQVDYVSGASILVRTESVQTELFDPFFIPAYFEDTDLSFRLRQENWKVVYVPYSIVVHHEGKSHGTELAAGIKRYQVENQKKFSKRWAKELSHHLRADPLSVTNAAFRLEILEAKKVVLWVDYQLPDPTKDSGSVRTVALAKVMKSLGFFTVFVPLNPSTQYLSPYYMTSNSVLVEKSIDDAVRTMKGLEIAPEFIFISRITVASEVFENLKALFPSAKFIFDTVDLHFLRLRRQASETSDMVLKALAKNLEARELKMVESCDLTFVVSDYEADLLRKAVPEAKISVISNIHYFDDTPQIHEERSGMVFVGSFNHPPNELALGWFFQRVWPELNDSVKEEGLTIIGPNPPAWLENLDDVNVKVLGWVEDAADYVSKAKVSIAPLTVGAGVKGKVGEAVSRMTPVVGTSIAFEGMGLIDEVSCLERNDGVSFARAIEALIGNESQRKSIAMEAARSLQSRFSQAAVKESLDASLELLGKD